MKIYEILNKKLDIPTPTPEQLAVKYQVPIEKIFHELDKGIKVELEHTTDMNIAAEIALDHLNELLDYYERLEKVENSSNINEGEVIKNKFKQKLATKKGVFHNPDIITPVSRFDKKPFDRFETIPIGKNSSLIIGVRNNGYEEKLSVTRTDIANALAGAYNTGGYTNKDIKKIDLKSYFKEGTEKKKKKRKSTFQILKDNKIQLTPKEREKIIKAGAVWHNGPGGKTVPAIWKSKDSKGNIKYISNTHRLYQVRDTLPAAIKAFDIVKQSA